MTRRITFAALAAAIAITSFQTASAQVVAYDHRSTVWGDYMAGYAEAVHARGLAARNYAEAYRTYIDAERERASLRYDVIQTKLYLDEQKRDSIRERAEYRRQQQQREELEQDQESLDLLKDVQRGVHLWPEALQRPEYVQSVSLIHRVLRNWTPNESPNDNAYRRALLTEAGVLQSKVASDDSIDFHSRVEAVRTLKTVARLAKLDGIDAAARSLAMR